MSEAENAHSDPEAVTGEETDPTRLSRRTVIQATLAGTVAAAVWSAPHIEGLSIAPDYAAAASCTGGSITQVTKNSNDDCCGNQECWGNGSCGNFSVCSGNGCNPVGYGANVSGQNFTLNGNIGGDVNGDNGFVNLTVGGIDPPFQKCTVTIAGNCDNGGSFRTNGSSVAFNNNGNVGPVLVDCQGGGNVAQADPNGQIRINMTCVCNNTAN